MKLGKVELHKVKKDLVDLIKANPGIDNAACAAHMKAEERATSHRLSVLEDAGYITREMIAIPCKGGLKATWWFLRDFNEPLIISETAVARQSRKRRARELAEIEEAKYRAAFPEVTIFQLYTPAIPEVKPGAHRVTNDKFDRDPIQQQGGQGARRHTDWRRTDSVATLCL